MSDHLPPSSSESTPDWEAIARYLGGGGSPEERASLERDLEAAPGRPRLLAELGSVLQPADPARPAPAEVEAALKIVLARRADMGDAKATVAVPIDRYRSRRIVTGWRAAAAILVVASAPVVWRASTLSRATVVAQPDQTRYATAIGRVDSVTLSDGTRVLLGPGSEIRLAANFGSSSRELSLSGEARFDVKHDEERPFVVRAGAATFRDVGTVFSIHSDAVEGARIVVTEGAVVVEGASAGSPVTLLKGDRAMVNIDGKVNTERAAFVPEDTAWAAGKLVFRDASLGQVISDVRRWYGIELRVDPQFAANRVSAEFDRQAGADVGRVVAALLGGGFQQSGSVVHIVPPPGASARK